MLRFIFDPAKEAENLRKHGVPFADAEGVFYDVLAIHAPASGCKGRRTFDGNRAWQCGATTGGDLHNAR